MVLIKLKNTHKLYKLYKNRIFHKGTNPFHTKNNNPHLLLVMTYWKIIISQIFI